METQPNNRPRFKVAGNATIKHLNVRKEGPDDDQQLAVDVKLEFSQIGRELCNYFDDALTKFLWRGNSDALIVRNNWMAPVVYTNEVSGAEVTIAGRRHVGCNVRKFNIDPRDGGVISMTCSVTLYPSSTEVSDLANLVQDDDYVSIEGPAGLFDAPEGGGAC